MVYYVYVLASRRYGTLYIGMTNNLPLRLDQHRKEKGSAFVRWYGVHQLVYVENYDGPLDAIRREKQLKWWKRDWKFNSSKKTTRNGVTCPTS
jgi:putative endonuclease